MEISEELLQTMLKDRYNFALAEARAEQSDKFSNLHQKFLDLRETLATEIEAEMRDTREFDTLNNARNTGLRRAAFIVRGGKKDGKHRDPVFEE
jgi:hypothetical protein